LIFGIAVVNNLYAIVWQRNHLGIMSSIPLPIGGGIYSYDFTTSGSKAYGNNQVFLGAGEYGLYTGDGNGNGTVQLDDISTIWAGSSGAYGYFLGDYNLNGQVNNQDKNDVCLPNLGKTRVIP
jgi:hypothetical protein